VCSDAEYLQWLMAEDEASREARLERLRWLVETFGEPRHLLFRGGPISYRAFEEARLCFLNGQFIATTLLSQVVLEHMLAGLFHSAGRDDLKGSGFKRLMKEAVKEGIINDRGARCFRAHSPTTKSCRALSRSNEPGKHHLSRNERGHNNTTGVGG